MTTKSTKGTQETYSGGFLNKNAARLRNPKCPDVHGHITLSEGLLKYLLRQYKAGEKPSLQIAGWKKVSPKGQSYYAVAVTEPYKPPQDVAEDDSDLI